jgi:3-phosphoshikimate 1-carboxyvinyltransferase
MLTAMGGEVEARPGYAMVHPRPLRCIDIDVPGDPSAAALVGAAVATIPGSAVTFPGLLLNPTRVGFLAVLERMGVAVECSGRRTMGGEEVGDLRLAAPVRLQACSVTVDEVPSLVDEIPALAVVAAFAAGTSRFEGIAELRIKESDRIAAVEQLLAACGGTTRSGVDWLEVDGGTPQRPTELDPAPDHRMTMAACALALAADGVEGSVRGIEHADVSYPGFAADLERLGR